MSRMDDYYDNAPAGIFWEFFEDVLIYHRRYPSKKDDGEQTNNEMRV